MDPVTILLDHFSCQRLHIAIVGIGAVGGVFGSALLDACSGNDQIEISFLVTHRHYKPLSEHGLLISSNSGTRQVFPHTVANCPSLLKNPVQIMILAVKADQLNEVVHQWKPILAKNAWVISLMNGVDNGSRLLQMLPEKRIVDGCVYVGAHLISPGRVYWEGGPRKIFCGDISGNQNLLECLCNLFLQKDVQMDVIHPVSLPIWEKYLFVSPVATVSSIFCCTLKAILNHHDRLDLFKSLVEELRQLAVRLSFLPANFIVEKIVNQLPCFSEDTMSSLCRDLSQGRKGEFAILVEDVLSKAQKNGIDLPLYRQCREKLIQLYPFL